MPIQYAGGTNVNNTFANSGSATRREIVDGLVTELATAGWTTISGAGTGDVIMESATTPQSLKMRVRILDPGSGTCAQIKIRNASGSLVQTTSLHLRPENSKTWRVIANRYQCFIFVPGSTAARNFAGFGVPYLPANVSSLLYECIWGWGSANSDGDSTSRPHFRTHLGATANFSTASMCFITNGAMWENPDSTNKSYTEIGLPQLIYPQSANLNQAGSATGYRWHGDKAPMFEPYIGWGQTSSIDEGKVRGQLWDSVISLEQYAMDATATFDTRNWWNLTDVNAGVSIVSGRGSLWVVAP